MHNRMILSSYAFSEPLKYAESHGVLFTFALVLLIKYCTTNRPYAVWRVRTPQNDLREFPKLADLHRTWKNACHGPFKANVYAKCFPIKLYTRSNPATKCIIVHCLRIYPYVRWYDHSCTTSKSSLFVWPYWDNFPSKERQKISIGQTQAATEFGPQRNGDLRCVSFITKIQQELVHRA